MGNPRDSRQRRMLPAWKRRPRNAPPLPFQVNPAWESGGGVLSEAALSTARGAEQPRRGRPAPREKAAPSACLSLKPAGPRLAPPRPAEGLYNGNPPNGPAEARNLLRRRRAERAGPGKGALRPGRGQGGQPGRQPPASARVGERKAGARQHLQVAAPRPPPATMPAGLGGSAAPRFLLVLLLALPRAHNHRATGPRVSAGERLSPASGGGGGIRGEGVQGSLPSPSEPFAASGEWL